VAGVQIYQFCVSSVLLHPLTEWHAVRIGPRGVQLLLA
jgi:hypothetical protein